MMRRHFLVLPTALLSACISLAPEYERPPSPVPAQWPSIDGATSELVVSDIGWRDFFRDERLRQVVELALAHNRDLQLATLNIERARAQYRIQGAALFPSVSASAGQSVQSVPASVSVTGEGYILRQYSASVGFSAYELDLFGRVRNLKAQALEAYFAQAETQRSTQISLVAEVANAWLSLAADRALLDLARETFESLSESLKLTARSHELGVASALDLAQARGSVEAARADLAGYRALVAQDRNGLEWLVGAPLPDALLPEAAVEPVTALSELPAALSSDVLLRRPDVLAAEHQLIAANADIGVARAAFFPSISLTGSVGTASSDLSQLFSGGTRNWSYSPSINLPIFAAGANRATLDVARLDRDIAVAQYDSAIQTAFREVADALALRGTIDEQWSAQQARVDATQRSVALSEARYRSGIDSYLNLLDAQRTLYAAQQALIAVQLSREANRVTLYKVLGGGVRAGGAS